MTLTLPREYTILSIAKGCAMSEENNTHVNQSNQSHETQTQAPEKTELQESQELAEKYKNDFLYLRAEFENYKRNAIKERSDLIKYSGERLAIDLLDVVDNFERALETPISQENFNDFKKGVDLISANLKSLLQKHNINEIPSLGTAFDPNFHEALSTEATNEFQSGHVSRVFKKPYKFHEKIIRTGQVVVAKKAE